MQHDGSNSARARSARIRSSHDDESNQLGSMRRRTAEGEAREARVSLVARLVSTLRRRSRGDLVVPIEPAESCPGGTGAGAPSREPGPTGTCSDSPVSRAGSHRRADEATMLHAPQPGHAHPETSSTHEWGAIGRRALPQRRRASSRSA
jgi:hypothetical protein